MKINSQTGISIVELIAGFAIFGLIIVSAIPHLGDLNQTFSKSNAIKEIEFSIQRAKSEALANGSRAIFAVSGDGRSYSVGFDVLPYSSSPAIADTILFQEILPSTITLDLANPLIFDSRGFLIDESETPTTRSITFYSSDSDYCSATILSTGQTSFSC